MARPLRLANLRYWLRLLWPFGFASLLSPLTLLIAAPEYLSTRSPRTLSAPYRVPLHGAEIPFLYAAAVLGVVRLWRWLGGGVPRREKLMKGQRVRLETLALLVLLCALAGNYFLGPLPFSLPGAYDGGLRQTAHDVALDEAVAMIPRTP